MSPSLFPAQIKCDAISLLYPLSECSVTVSVSINIKECMHGMHEPGKVILGSGYHTCNGVDFLAGNVVMRQGMHVVQTYVCDSCM